MAKREILNNDVVTLRVGEGAVDLVEGAVDAVENVASDVFDTVERVVTVTKNNPLVIAAAFVAGAAIAGFVTYKIVEKRLSEKFDEELGEQIAAAKEYHMRLNKEGEFESPESAVKALVPDEIVEAVQTYQGRQERVPYNNPDEIVVVEPVVVEKTVTTNNVFVQSRQEPDPRDWDYNAELADRELHPDIPYTISFDEFNENEDGHEQTTLTYYAQDDTLVDSMDKPIDNVEYTVGEDNLLRFGHGSGDQNVVYVRNNKIDMDFEIIRENGSYHKQLFGTDPEPTLQHSRRTNRRGWRADE